MPSGGPTLLLTDGSSTWPLVNTLGSCLTTCSSSNTVQLWGTNIFDASVQNGATVWDTAAANPGFTTSVSIPCYASGSPASTGGQPYLGGDMAFAMLAWGGTNAGTVTAEPPTGSSACSFTGSSWFVDLKVSLQLAQVVVVAGSGGVSGITIAVGDSLKSLGACASGLSVAAGGTTVVACTGTGRYLSVSGGTMQLCSVQVYPAIANNAPGKQYYYTTGSGVGKGVMWTGTQSLTAQAVSSSSTAAFVLDLGYQSVSIQGGLLWAGRVQCWGE